MTRYFTLALVFFALTIAACSTGSSSVSESEKRQPCPPDLTVPCGRTPSGNYYRL